MRSAMHKLMTTGLLGLILAAGPLAGRASAQPGDDPATRRGTTTDANDQYRGDNTDDGFDLGWLGLLGLAGLAGLMRRKDRVVTTHRTADSASR